MHYNCAKEVVEKYQSIGVLQTQAVAVLKKSFARSKILHEEAIIVNLALSVVHCSRSSVLTTASTNGSTQTNPDPKSRATEQVQHSISELKRPVNEDRR